MKRSSFRSLVPFAACGAVVAPLFFAIPAQAKYAPPPLPAGSHCVSEVGWMAPADRRKVDEESEIARIQTGFVIDVLLAKGDEPIEEVANETFQAWRPGDPAKDNGILLVIQPNFPRGSRKVRLQVGTGVAATLTPEKANGILRTVINPILNNGDQVRLAVAEGVNEIAKALGADESVKLPADAAAPAADAAPTPQTPLQGTTSKSAEGLGAGLEIVVGAGIVAVLGFLAYRRFKR